MTDVIMKCCTACKQIIPIDLFSKNRYKKDGYQDECKKCRVAQERERRGKHKKILIKTCVGCGVELSGMKRKWCADCYKKYLSAIAVEYRKTHPRAMRGCCKILKSHHEIMKDDPERLTTEFIKTLSRCECDTI